MRHKKQRQSSIHIEPDYNSEFLADLLMDFDGETEQEKMANWHLGYMAQNYPQGMTRKEIFIIGFLLERMGRVYSSVEYVNL